MRKFLGLLLLLAGVAAYLYYVQGWDWARLKRTSVVSFVLHEDASATATPIGARGVGTHWETAAPMPQTRTDFGAGVIGDTIYVVGGVDGYLRSLNSVEAYDIGADRWREVAKLPQPIHHPAVATDGSKLYVLGGFTGLAARPLDSAYVYDPATGAWQELGRLNDFRGGAAAAFMDGRLYMTGGQTGAGLDGDLEFYNFERRGWNGLKLMPTPRTQLQAAPLDGRLYAIGGNKGSLSKSVATTEAYEPGVDAWHPMPDMSVARSGFAAAVQGGRIYVFGGENKDGTIDSIETFDPGRGKWSTLDLKMADPRHGLAAVAWKDRIYVLGGGRRSGLSVTDLNSVLVFGQTPAPPAK